MMQPVTTDAPAAEPQALLRRLLDAPTSVPGAGPAAPLAAGGVAVGCLVAIGASGAAPLVRTTLQDDAPVLPARATVALGQTQVGQAVVLAFERGDPALPIVIGVLAPVAGEPAAPPLRVESAGEQLIVSSMERLVIRCGKASITLQRDGKVTIRGTQVISHSEGINRIRGGSVQIN